MARGKRGARVAPIKGAYTKINLREAASEACEAVPDGDYAIHIEHAEIVESRKGTLSVRLTGRDIDTSRLICLQPMCIFDPGARGVPHYVATNSRLLVSMLEAGGADVPDDLGDAAGLIDLRVVLELQEITDRNQLHVNQVITAYPLDDDDGAA